MKLIELFEPQKINTPKIKEYSYEVEQEIGGRKIMFMATNTLDEDDEDTWQIDFAEYLDQDVDEPYVSNKTGKGHEFEVFSFVVACAKDFIKKKDPSTIILRSVISEPNRATLYNRLARRFGDDYNISKAKTSRYHMTVLSKRR